MGELHTLRHRVSYSSFKFSCYSYAHLRGINIQKNCLHPSLEGRGNMVVLMVASVPVKDKHVGWFHFQVQFKYAPPAQVHVINNEVIVQF